MKDSLSWSEKTTLVVENCLPASRFNMIMARDKETLVCGIGDQMPWYVPEDLSFFARMTKGHTVVMGHNTMLSLGSVPLRDRRNIVISTTLQEAPEGFEVIHDLSALREVEGNIFFIGGPTLISTVRQDYMNIPEYNVYLTELEGTEYIKDLPPELKPVHLPNLFLFRKKEHVFTTTMHQSDYSSVKLQVSGYRCKDVHDGY